MQFTNNGTVSQELEIFEDFSLGVDCENQPVDIISFEVYINLSPYNLNPTEVDKFKAILKALNAAIAQQLSQRYPATSVISGIRPRSSDRY